MSFPQAPLQGAKKEKPPLHAYGEKVSTTTLLTHLGVGSCGHSGIHMIDESTVLAATGNLALFINYATGEISSMMGPTDGGVGAVAVHPSKTRFVICEKSFDAPRVVVYEYPSRKEVKVMKNGAQQGYSACAFNTDGKLLATVATEPDYVITVWNWEQEAIVLRNKAFSADVFSVMFSPFSDSMLITSGLGHLKVWDMASTFTGLKLQGTVGKFGKVEISDVSGYFAMPDNKVLSGSEFGTLLLWEAHLVKCEIMRIDDTPKTASNSPHAANSPTSANSPNAAVAGGDASFGAQVPETDNTTNNADDPEEEDGAEDPLASTAVAGLIASTAIPIVNGRKLLKCHDGNIEVVKLIEDNKIIMTAGHDGYVRYWSFGEIDVLEPTGVTHIVGVKMLKELFLGEDVKAKSVTLAADRSHWVLLDEGGSIRTFPRWPYSYIVGPATAAIPDNTAQYLSGPLLEFFDGPITGIIASPNDRSVVIAGADGTVRLFDTPNKNELYRAAFDAGVTHLQFLPKAIDPTGTVFFVGFANGCVRILRKCRDGFEILAAWRPHSAKLVGIALSADATQVYTAAEDGTAFYSKLSYAAADSGDSLVITPEPFGFCQIPDQAVPTALEWAAEGDVCFFGFASGMLLAVKPPTEKPNHDETFEFAISYAGVGYRQKKKPPQREKKVVINPNDHEESSSDEDDEDEDQGPWAVKAIKRLPNNGGYAIAMEKEELAYVYDLSIRYEDKLGPPPIPPTGVDPPGRVEEPGANIAFRDYVPIGIAVSQDEKTLMVTFSHGEVVMRPLAALTDVKSPVAHARQYHDSVEGFVTGMAMLFDNSALITVGSDGLVVTHQIEGVAPPTGKVNLITLPKSEAARKQGKADKRKAVIDLNIEDQRRKEDREAAEALAEGKRSIIKKKIAAVHKEYLEILSLNDESTGGRKLSEEELTLDPELNRLLQLEKVNRVEEASVELSWKVAFKEQLLKQLRGTFVDTMTYDRFAVRSFDKKFSVASIRTPAFTPAQREKLEALQRAIQKNLGLQPDDSNLALGVNLDEDRPLSPEGDGERTPYGSPAGYNGSGGADYASGDDAAADADLGPNDSNAGAAAAAGGGISPNDTNGATMSYGDALIAKNKMLKSQLDKAEERKRERLERKKGLEDLLARKPKPSDVDPFMASEIRYAREHMGDKVLKTAPEYRVPTNLIPTAERKAKQLILLEHSINNLRAAFNDKLLALRDMKRNACAELNQDRARLAEIIAILNLDKKELPPPFELKAIEEPEKRFEISDGALRKWAKEKAKEQRRLEAQQRANKGFGADLASGEDEKKSEEESDDSDMSDFGDDDHYASDDDDEANKKRALNAAKRASRISGGHRESTFNRKPSLLSLKEKLEMDLKVRLENVRLGELEEEEAIIQRETLLYEKGRLLRRIEAAKKSYDDKLLEFLQERMRLEADICMADMRALLLFREFRMLLNFKKKDEELEAIRDARLADQHAINSRIKNISNDIEGTRDRQLRVNDGFITNRHDAETHIKTAFPLQDQPYLLEVFNRKIKRVKAVDANEDDDDAPTSSEDEEEDTTGDDFIEAKPATCDEAAWQQLLQFREGRLDLEDAQHALKLKFNEFEKLLAKVRDKERGKVEKELADSLKAIDDFQLEKQRQLNLLETIVVLKLSQIQCLSDDGQRKVPHDLQKAPVIVFTETAINGLRSRIGELAEEKHDLARKAEQLARAKQALLRRKSKRQLEHADWEQRVNEVQLLKFGQKVDLEALENLAVDRETEELKQYLKMEEIKWERELRKQDNRVQTLRHDHQSRIGENTMLLKDLGNIREEQQVLEHALTTSTQKIVGKMAGGSKVATAADRAQLKDLVVRQQQELDMLGNEITMLKRKGGHVYTPVIQRLAQQEQQQQAFSSSMPMAGGGGAAAGSPPNNGFSNTYTAGTAPNGQQQQQPSSAPSGQQLGGINGQRLAGGASSVVVRPSLMQSARQPAPVAVGKRPANMPGGTNSNNATPPSPPTNE